jgi:hypothetical protein
LDFVEERWLTMTRDWIINKTAFMKLTFPEDFGKETSRRRGALGRFSSGYIMEFVQVNYYSNFVWKSNLSEDEEFYCDSNNDKCRKQLAINRTCFIMIMMCIRKCIFINNFANINLMRLHVKS